MSLWDAVTDGAAAIGDTFVDPIKGVADNELLQRGVELAIPASIPAIEAYRAFGSDALDGVLGNQTAARESALKAGKALGGSGGGISGAFGGGRVKVTPKPSGGGGFLFAGLGVLGIGALWALKARR